MNKQDLIDHIAKDFALTKTSGALLVEGLFAKIAEAVSRGEEVAVAGFGKFVAKQRIATTARNPQTGEKIAVPAKTVAQFKPHKAFAAAVNQVKEGGS